MKKPGIRVFASLFLAHLVLGILVFMDAWFKVPTTVAPGFVNDWILGTALYSFVDGVPAAVIAGVTLAWSFLIDKNLVRQFLGKEGHFWKMLRSSLVMAVVFATLYFLVLGFAQDSFSAMASKALSDSALSELYFEKAKSARFEKNLNRAYEEIRKSLIILPANKAAQAFREEVLMAIAEEHKKPKEIIQEIPDNLSSLSVQELLEAARRFTVQEDWYSALYYAETALKVSRGDDKVRCELLIAEIRSNIGTSNLDRMSRRELQIHDIKQRAIVRNYRNGQMVEAYFALKELESIAPNDQDLKLWLPRVVSALDKVAFFHEELENAMGRASAKSLFVVFPQSDGSRILLYADKVLQGQFTEYLTGMELVHAGAGGQVRFRVKAPWAKIARGGDGWMIQTQSILRVKEAGTDGIRSRAEIIQGTRPSGEDNIYPIPLQGSVLLALARTGSDYRSSSMAELFWFLEVLPKLSYDVRPVQMELLDRFMKGASVLVFWFFAIAIGWANRSRYMTKPLGIAFLTIVALPFAAGFVARAFMLLAHNSLAGVLVMGGFEWALGAAFTFTGIAVLSALFMAAMQRFDQ